MAPTGTISKGVRQALFTARLTVARETSAMFGNRRKLDFSVRGDSGFGLKLHATVKMETQSDAKLKTYNDLTKW